MIWLLYILHAGVCVVLILVVLLQSGKAADLAGAFGGGGSQTALGSRGAATVLSKATTVCAILFMLTSLTLAILGSRRGGSVLEQVPIAPPTAPASSAPPSPGAQGAGSAAPAAPADQKPAGTQAPATGQAPPSGKPAGGR